MNRKEFVKRVADKMREDGVRKPISAQRQVFHISDNEGNASDFIIKKSDKTVQYTQEDIESVIDACISIIEDALKVGDYVSIRGFGTLGLHYRKARKVKHPDTGLEVEVSDRYVPKFTFGKDLRMCAKLFEIALEEGVNRYDIEEDIVHEDGDDYGD